MRDTKSRVEIGTLAPIDIVQAESEVASREEAVIVAQASIGQAEDVLRTLIFDPKTPDFWSMRLKPTDVAPFMTQAVDVDAAVKNALNDRTDLTSARKRMEITDYDLKYLQEPDAAEPRRSTCATTPPASAARRHCAIRTRRYSRRQ